MILKMKIIKDVNVKLYGVNVKCKLVKDYYENNAKVYYGLIEVKTGDSFSDITVNIDNSDRNYIDNDFLNIVFDGNSLGVKKRLKQNLNIDAFGKNEENGFYYFTLLKN